MNVWRKIVGLIRSKQRENAVVIPRAYHRISHKAISSAALSALRRLQKAGFSAYLVGGSVRDALLDMAPKDFDVVTNAHPEQVRTVFKKNSRIIGRRFRLVHVYFGSEVIEVSTFRANTEEKTQSEDDDEQELVIRDDNTYGTIEEDAWRRDFTINAIYYNIEDHSITDYTGGMWDVKRKLIRMIGDPVQRFHEDPVRLLRALRLSAKLGFTLHKQTEQAVLQLPHLLCHVPRSRLFDETLKLFFYGYSENSFLKLMEYQYLSKLFPSLTELLQRQDTQSSYRLVILALRACDQRFHDGRSLNPGFLLAVLYWPVLQQHMHLAIDQKIHSNLHKAVDSLFKEELKNFNIPRRITGMMHAIWILQYHLERRRPSRMQHICNHRYFRAGIDFLKLRAQIGEVTPSLCDWWFTLRDASPQQRIEMIEKM